MSDIFDDNHIQEHHDSDTLQEVREPPLYRILMYNDDYTSMEFVVEVLENVFHKNASEATQIMLNVHNSGIGLCGVYPYDIAETKVLIVRSMAEMKGFPLRCSMEEE